MEVKRVFKLTLAQYLVDHGCPIIETVPDLVKPNRKNWIFEDTPELNELMTKYTQTLRKEV